VQRRHHPGLGGAQGSLGAQILREGGDLLGQGRGGLI